MPAHWSRRSPGPVNWQEHTPHPQPSQTGANRQIRSILRSINTMDSLETFLKFVEAINRHDVAAIKALMTDDHIFVDSLGHRVQGASSMEQGWKGYFVMCPDYWIRADDAAARQGIVLAAGDAGGTIDDQLWRTPAAWKAIIRDNKVAEWHVFADNKPVYSILARRQNATP